jgi:hypothetical protein
MTFTTFMMMLRDIYPALIFYVAMCAMILVALRPTRCNQKCNQGRNCSCGSEK